MKIRYLPAFIYASEKLLLPLSKETFSKCNLVNSSKCSKKALFPKKSKLQNTALHVLSGQLWAHRVIFKTQNPQDFY